MRRASPAGRVCRRSVGAAAEGRLGGWGGAVPCRSAPRRGQPPGSPISLRGRFGASGKRHSKRPSSACRRSVRSVFQGLEPGFGEGGAPASSPGGGLRPASRVSAKPALTTLRPANLTAANDVAPICVESRGRLGERRPPVGTAGRSPANDASPPEQNHGQLLGRPMERWRNHVLPVGASDRHRAGARNPHQQRCAPPISPLRTAHRRSALNRGDGLGNADLRSARMAWLSQECWMSRLANRDDSR